MTESQTETVRLIAQVTGEMAADSISIGQWANVEGLTQGDTDPLQVVVRVPEGQSSRGWYYLPEVLNKVAGEINRAGLPGYEGHQRPEDVNHEFKPIVTHWLGAKVVDESGKKVLYARGQVDSAASTLKRWIKGKMVREVSIFGMPSLRTGSNGRTEVYDYKPFSLDWTPPGRAGMPTSVVYAGEMDSTFGNNGTGANTGGQSNTNPPRRKSRMGTIREATDSLRDQSATPQVIIGEMRWQPREVLGAFSRRDLVDALDQDTLAAVPVGEIAKAHTLPALLPAYSGLKLGDLAPLIDKEEWGRLLNIATAVGEMAQVLGLESGKDSAGEVAAAVKGLHEQSTANAKAARDGVIDKVVGEMITVQDLRPIVVDTLQRELPATGVKEDDVKKLVGEMKDRPTLKPLFARAGNSAVINPQSDNRGGTAGNGQGGSTESHTPGTLRRVTRRLVG